MKKYKTKKKNNNKNFKISIIYSFSNNITIINNYKIG